MTDDRHANYASMQKGGGGQEVYGTYGKQPFIVPTTRKKSHIEHSATEIGNVHMKSNCDIVWSVKKATRKLNSMYTKSALQIKGITMNHFSVIACPHKNVICAMLNKENQT